MLLLTSKGVPLINSCCVPLSRNCSKHICLGSSSNLTTSLRSQSQKALVNDLQAQPEQSEEDAGIVLDEYIGPGLQLMEQSLGIAERTIKLIVPRSSDAVLNFYIEAPLALGQFLVSRPTLVEDQRVCEIGAGLGIAGMVAAFAGASNVLLTDREPLALECARRSAIASGLQVSDKWQSSARNGKVSTELLDWTDPNPGLGRFDVLLACDVLYEKEAVKPVAELIAKLLSQRGGRFVLADPESRTEAHRQQFSDHVVRNVRHPMCIEFSDSFKISMDSIETEVRIMVFRSNWSNDTIGVKL